MPLMFFLKLYARFAGLVMLVLVVCVALFVGVNSVRSQFWHERFPEPLMRWLQSDPDAAERYHWLGSLYDFEVTSADELALSPVTLERLGYNQVVSWPPLWLPDSGSRSRCPSVADGVGRSVPGGG